MLTARFKFNDMALWRAEALKRLPELRKAIDSAEEIMALWIEVSIAFEKAYTLTPPNESLIARIYSFADWCRDARPGADAGHDPRTSAAVAFYEDIPTIPAARADMPRWFKPADIAALKHFFVYSFGEDGYQELHQYVTRNAHRYVPRPRQPDAHV